MMVVANDLIDAIADQRLAYAIRGRPQGEFILDAPIKNWLSDDALGIFEECTMPRTAIPDSRQGLYPGGFWVYVPRTSLDAYLGLPTDLSNYSQLHLSPYMRLIIELIQKMGIGPDNQPTVAEIAATVRQLAPGYNIPPPGDRIPDAIGTIVRELVPSQGHVRPERRRKPK
jgi:hypothetical protein